MKLIVGLGNPGKEYNDTRHNAGFIILEKFLEKKSGEWGNEAKGNAIVSRLKLSGEDIILALPQSYMNLSGEVVLELLHWYKLSIADLIVVHDELDIPFGTVQVKKNIGAAGHNGIKSIIEKLKSEDFVRVRVGIGQSDQKTPSEKYVLERFNEEQIRKMPEISDIAVEKIKLLIEHGYSDFISKYNK